MSTQSYLLGKKIPFTDACMTSGWAKKQFNTQGDSIISFVGPMNSKRLKEKDRDLADCELKLHFVIEHYGMNADGMECRRRLFLLLMLSLIGGGCMYANSELHHNEKLLSTSQLRCTQRSAKCHIALCVDSLSELDIVIDELIVSAHKHYCLGQDDMAENISRWST